VKGEEVKLVQKEVVQNAMGVGYEFSCARLARGWFNKCNVLVLLAKERVSSWRKGINAKVAKETKFARTERF